jgi:hypothetical protein
MPEQALVVFLELEFDELNQEHHILFELDDEDGNPAYLTPGPNAGGSPARFEQDIDVAPLPVELASGMAPSAAFALSLGQYALWVPHAGRRYVWSVRIGQSQDQLGFWVTQPSADS